jgi:hypothetical protein
MNTPVSPKVTASTVTAGVVTLVMYLLAQIPAVGAMPAAAQGALLVIVTAAVTYAAGYVTRDPLRGDAGRHSRPADVGPEAGASELAIVLIVLGVGLVVLDVFLVTGAMLTVLGICLLVGGVVMALLRR